MWRRVEEIGREGPPIGCGSSFTSGIVFWNRPVKKTVTTRKRKSVRGLQEIQEELEAATARRSELWDDLSLASDPETRSQIEELSRSVAVLWSELRAAWAHVRSGPRDSIIARAHVEDRFDREERRVRKVAA